MGAIANEIGLSSQYIGRIQLNDDHSTVDLPSGMPKEMFYHLKKVRVRHKPLDIELLSQHASGKDAEQSATGTAYRNQAKKAKTGGKKRSAKPSNNANDGQRPVRKAKRKLRKD